MKTNQIIQGDCIKEMKKLPENSIDTIITDPPYGLEFMGKEWDRGIPGIPFWAEMLRVAKPGATLLCFGGTRTYHRLACAIEDAGWVIKDCIMWLYGSGFPKSTNVAKQLKKKGYDKESEEWSGWGTHLKPAYEPILVAMKPNEGSYAQNALKHGVSGLNIDGGRIGYKDEKDREGTKVGFTGPILPPKNGWNNNNVIGTGSKMDLPGRFPANIILDQEASKELPNNVSRFFKVI